MNATETHHQGNGADGLPAPSRTHATCAWCHAEFGSIVDLLDHADAGHLASGTVPTWAPSELEVRAIVDELRPMIAAFAERDAHRLETWAADQLEVATAA